jgi:hypothetical protein
MPRVFLEIDAQGYDVEVVNGATGCLEAIAAIQSELSVEPSYHGMPSCTEALSLYHRPGYRLVGMSEIAHNPDLGSVTEMNCVLI